MKSLRSSGFSRRAEIGTVHSRWFAPKTVPHSFITGSGVFENMNNTIRLHKDRGDAGAILKAACEELNCGFVGEIPIKIRELKQRGRLSSYRIADFLFGTVRFRNATDNRVSVALMETFLMISLHEGKTVSELAGHLMKDPIGVYNDTKRLEGYGLVTFEIVEDDAPRRGKAPRQVFLSKDGRKLLEEMLA
jgi:DNA-binding MarR family transcriptional regulator